MPPAVPVVEVADDARRAARCGAQTAKVDAGRRRRSSSGARRASRRAGGGVPSPNKIADRRRRASARSDRGLRSRRWSGRCAGTSGTGRRVCRPGTIAGEEAVGMQVLELGDRSAAGRRRSRRPGDACGSMARTRDDPVLDVHAEDGKWIAVSGRDDRADRRGVRQWLSRGWDRGHGSLQWDAQPRRPIGYS